MAKEKSFADLLQEYRLRAKLKIQELSERANVSRNSITAWEKGIRTPNKAIMRDLADALGLSTQETESFENIAAKERSEGQINKPTQELEPQETSGNQTDEPTQEPKSPVLEEVQAHRLTKSRFSTIGLGIALVLVLAAAISVLQHALNQTPQTGTGQPTVSALSPQAILIPTVAITNTKNLIVDGKCNKGSEYSNALAEPLDRTTLAVPWTGTVYIQHDELYLYVCIRAQIGIFPRRNGAIYLSPHNHTMGHAQSDDYKMEASVLRPDNTTFVGQGDPAQGYRNYYSTNPVRWQAVASSVQGKEEIIEFRIDLKSFDLDPCNSNQIFRINAMHHWVMDQGDDFGWPSSHWWDQPGTWQAAQFANGSCK